MDTMEALAAEFERELYDSCAITNVKYHHTNSRFLQMLANHGGVETARILLTTPLGTQTGLFRMYHLGRLDLTTEYILLKPKYVRLFSQNLRDEAKARLDKFK